MRLDRAAALDAHRVGVVGDGLGDSAVALLAGAQGPFGGGRLALLGPKALERVADIPRYILAREQLLECHE